jgi:hypothetical protein
LRKKKEERLPNLRSKTKVEPMFRRNLKLPIDFRRTAKNQTEKMRNRIEPKLSKIKYAPTSLSFCTTDCDDGEEYAVLKRKGVDWPFKELLFATNSLLS